MPVLHTFAYNCYDWASLCLDVNQCLCPTCHGMWPLYLYRSLTIPCVDTSDGLLWQTVLAILDVTSQLTCAQLPSKAGYMLRFVCTGQEQRFPYSWHICRSNYFNFKWCFCFFTDSLDSKGWPMIQCFKCMLTWREIMVLPKTTHSENVELSSALVTSKKLHAYGEIHSRLNTKVIYESENLRLDRMHRSTLLNFK